MAVQIVDRPDPFALTKGGRMVYQFQGLGRVQTQGVAPIAFLFLQAPIVEGTKLDLRWNGVTHTLLFTAAPSAPNEFSTGDGGQAYVTALLEALQAYFPVREDFTLSAGSTGVFPGGSGPFYGIEFNARRPGKAFELSANVPDSGPFRLTTTTAGADPLIRNQYSVYAELWVQKLDTPGTDLFAHYERVTTKTMETDAAGLAEWDVGNTLQAYLEADLPNWNGHLVSIGRKSQRQYYIAFAEAYGMPMEIGRLKNEPVKKAYLGGSNYLAKAEGGLPFLSERTASAADDKALRFGPLERFILTDEPQFLTFLNSRADLNPVFLEIIRTYSDGTTETRVDSLDYVPMPNGLKLCVPTGPRQLELMPALGDARTLTEYTVQLVNHLQVYQSAKYRYILNYDYQENTRYFGYVNSLGAIDTISTFGQGSASLIRFFEQTARYVPHLYQVQDGEFTDFDISLQQQIDVTTGYRSEAELLALNDFYRSRNRWQLINNRAIPVSISSKSIQQATDGDRQFAHKFTIVYQYRDDYYALNGDGSTTPHPPLGFTPAGPIVIEQPIIVNSYDPSVPNAVRELTAPIINGFKQAVAWGNHALGGYIDQGAGNLIWRRKDLKISWPSEVTDKPTTRNQAGLTDVPTIEETTKSAHQITSNLIGVRIRVKTWLTDQEPQ